MTHYNFEQHQPERVAPHSTSLKLHEDSYSMTGQLKGHRTETKATHLDFGPAPYPEKNQTQIIIIPIGGDSNSAARSAVSPPIAIGSEAAATKDSTQNGALDINTSATSKPRSEVITAADGSQITMFNAPPTVEELKSALGQH